MIDYFGALIRSSGLSVDSDVSAGTPAETPLDPAATDYGLVEFEIQRDTTPAATPAVPAQAAEHAPHTGAAEMRQTAIAPARAAYVERAPARSLPASSESIARQQSHTPDLGQAMVHAAMRWVAVDTHNAITSPEIVPMPRPTPPVPAMKVASHRASALTTPLVNVEEVRTVPRATTPLPPKVVTPIRVESIEHPGSIDRAAQRATGATRPVPHEEVVEISIGAIHLRVDAPPSQTVAQATPAPASRAMADRAPMRSGLARRALRRI